MTISRQTLSPPRLAPATAAPIAPITRLDANPNIIADAPITATIHSQVRFIPRIGRTLPQMGTDKIAVINTIAKMSEVTCGLARRVYLTQNGVARVYAPVVKMRKVTAMVNSKKGRSLSTSPKASFRPNGGALIAFG